MTLGFLLKPFERLDPGTWPTREFDSLGAALAEALQSAPGLKSLRAEQLAALSRPFSATYPQAHRAFSRLAGDQAGNAAERAQRLDDLLAVTGKATPRAVVLCFTPTAPPAPNATPSATVAAPSAPT